MIQHKRNISEKFHIFVSFPFNAEVDEDGDIISLTCKICHDNLAEIRKEARSRGYKGIVSGIESYADGTVTYVHKRGSCAT